MGKRLTSQNKAKDANNPILVTPRKSSVQFKIALEDALIAPYTFKKAKAEGAKGFVEFIAKTVGKHLSITAVENLYFRTDGPHGAKNKERIGEVVRDMYHFSNGSRQFRVHGYYNAQNYFCLCRLDPNHRYNFK
ncbi:MAG6450 family protein [Lactiplantibacillus pentosus]|uniref:MAG6450 family protein n=1 Tax=Lactiplantibacillus pentosus TaxID=1589 RepID=UPI003D7B36EC